MGSNSHSGPLMIILIESIIKMINATIGKTFLQSVSILFIFWNIKQDQKIKKKNHIFFTISLPQWHWKTWGWVLFRPPSIFKPFNAVLLIPKSDDFRSFLMIHSKSPKTDCGPMMMRKKIKMSKPNIMNVVFEKLDSMIIE